MSILNKLELEREQLKQKLEEIEQKLKEAKEINETEEQLKKSHGDTDLKSVERSFDSEVLKKSHGDCRLPSEVFKNRAATSPPSWSLAPLDANASWVFKKEVELKEQLEKKRLQDIQSKDYLDADKKNIEDEISSFESDAPKMFMGLNVKEFGMPSENLSGFKNPFFKIKEIAINKKNSWEDRTQAIRYMQRIPHIKRIRACLDAITTIITDEQYSIESRYHFFSNSEKYIKLDYELVTYCHHFFFFNFYKFPHILTYRILSAQYLLEQSSVTQEELTVIQTFLLDLAKDKHTEVHYRAECADILSRIGYPPYKRMGSDIINELGMGISEGGSVNNKLLNIYSNLENVHDETINKSVIDTLRLLIEKSHERREVEQKKENENKGETDNEIKREELPERNTGEIYERIVNLTNEDPRKENIINSFNRIIIDTAKYEGLNMSEILMLTWDYIINSNDRKEMEKRMLDELDEMYKTCSTGHLSRIMNILSGFSCDFQPVKISFQQQLRSNVLGRYFASLKTLSKQEQEDITNEITSGGKGENIKEFIFSYSPREELQNEFKNYMKEEEFNICYQKAENDFFGISN